MRHQACHKASRIFFCADCHISPPSIVLVSVAPPCVGVDRRSPCGVFSFARPPSSRRQRKPTAASPSAERGTPFVSPSNLDTMPHFFRQLCRWFMRHFVPSAPSTSAASPHHVDAGSLGRFAPCGGEGGGAFAPSRAPAPSARGAARVSQQPAGRGARNSRARIGRPLPCFLSLGGAFCALLSRADDRRGDNCYRVVDV